MKKPGITAGLRLFCDCRDSVRLSLFSLFRSCRRDRLRLAKRVFHDAICQNRHRHGLGLGFEVQPGDDLTRKLRSITFGFRHCFLPPLQQRLHSPLPELALKCARGERAIATNDGKKDRPNCCRLDRSPSINYGRNLVGKCIADRTKYPLREYLSRSGASDVRKRNQ